jgi:diguanylate cyclase (GGDEF)-like protein/putative nucleotidyltransferase with HDIG domain
MMKDNSANTTDAALRVLVVDDEAPIRELFTLALEGNGYRVASAENARQGLQTLMQSSFDVLVVDMRMDNIPGDVFLQEALKIWPWLGVVVVSGHIDSETISKLSAMGVEDILEKPVAIDDLIQKIERIGPATRARWESVPKTHGLSLMRDHLRLLDRLDESAISSDTLVGTLEEFGFALAEKLTADIVGILVNSGDDLGQELILIVQSDIDQSFLDRATESILDRYALISGDAPDRENLKVKVNGELSAPEPVPAEIGTALSVPILLKESFCGSLTLISKEVDAYPTESVSVLYHAANHIAAVFVALRRMHRLATRDHLTGLYNRIRLEEELERTWAMSQRYSSPMSLVVVDIDNFKLLNDSYGHAVGDEVLRDLAGLLENAARATDVVARYGGDEFVAVLPVAGEADARIFGQRFLDLVRNHLFCPDTLKLRLHASVGVACSNIDNSAATADELLSQADRALYLAKRGGRDRLSVWPERSATASDGAEPSTKLSLQRIIVVDDESAVLSLVESMLVRLGYDVVTCDAGHEVIKTLRDDPGGFDLLLTDLSMPGMTGIEILQGVAGIDNSIVKIVMTGYATVDTAVDCLREGAYDFIQKPVRMGELSALIKRALEYRRLKLENAKYQTGLEQMVRERSEKLAATLEEVRHSYKFTLEAMIAMLDARERQTGRHSVRTRDLAVELARSMGVSGADLDVISDGAFLHDIGKIAVPDAILLKAGPLTEEEWTIMKKHCETGFNILSSSPYLERAAEIVYAHHEKFEGGGYPRDLKGEEICLGARIFSVIDAYDAMRSNRVYRASLPVEHAVEEIRKCSGAQFDPVVVEAFLAHSERLEVMLMERMDDFVPEQIFSTATSDSG